MRQLAWWTLLAVGVCACGTPPVPTTPPATESERAALSVFQDPSADLQDDPATTFGPYLSPPDDERDRAVLADTLETLRGYPAPEVVGVEQLDGLRRVVVDLESELPGGGSARFTVQTERDDEGDYRVVWFQGPGVEWPPTPRRRGPATTNWPESP